MLVFFAWKWRIRWSDPGLNPILCHIFFSTLCEEMFTGKLYYPWAICCTTQIEEVPAPRKEGASRQCHQCSQTDGSSEKRNRTGQWNRVYRDDQAGLGALLGALMHISGDACIFHPYIRYIRYPRFRRRKSLFVACMCCGRSALEAALEAGLTSATRMTLKATDRWYF